MIVELLKALGHRCQRMTWQVGLGCALLFVSNFVPVAPKDKETLSTAGGLIITTSVANWMAGQGKRRMRADGEPVRKPDVLDPPPPPPQETT